MDEAAKKTALRMIPYGIYILTAKSGDEVAAATVNWVTQTSFEPPLIAVAIKSDSGAYGLVRKTGAFALNMLGKGQAPVGFTFFKPAQLDGDKISGEPFRAGANGAPVLSNALACIECKVTTVVEQGDHHIFVAQVTSANVARQPDARPDDAILWMKDLGEKVFYGG